MKILKFRILNYKSIIDSGYCYPSERVTILAGKNEAGKSSILEALEDFNSGEPIRKSAYPITHSEMPEISIWFEIEHDDLDGICENAELDITALPSKAEICVTKAASNTYSISGDFVERFLPESDIDYIQRIRDAYDAIATRSIKEVASKVIALPTLTLTDLNKAKNIFVQYQTNITPHLASFSTTDQQTLKTGLHILIECFDSAESNQVSPRMLFSRELIEWLPNFIMFSSFDDVFPNTIPLDELKDSEWISDLKEITDINIDVISGDNDRNKMHHKKYLNTELNNDFRQFWSQDLSQLLIEWDNEKLMFWIEEDGHYYEPEIRSQGRRWHLAFYIKVSARAKESVRNVILIDEPGLYLHANAQRDILKNLETAGEEVQVIFSTHSPYLIESDKLDRIRLVQKFDDRGTVIENKVHSVSDKETLTPILTSIGLELTNGIANINQRNNVIVEGASDYFYLNALKRLFEWESVNFVSGGCSGNMPKIGTILQGWGCNVVYLYDNDQAYKDALKHIKKEWLTINTELVAKLPVDGAIEDIFSKEDFVKFVIADPTLLFAGRNSDFMKGKDKVLLSKKFIEKVNKESQEIELDASTRTNAKLLFEVLSTLFSELKVQ
ncbi:MAG: AAA family ATPase [Sideroxyarcus sp.]|nr:AAA family ATPase [Sideroxyarcus sp.]